MKESTKSDELNQKELLVAGGKGLVLVLIIFYTIRIFHLGFWSIILLFTSLSLAMYLWKAIRKKVKFSIEEVFKNVLTTFLTVLLILTFISWFGALGVWGYALGIILLACWRIFKRRELYLKCLRHAETKIWGKPLDKEHWQKEKPRMPKIVWRKQKNERTKRKG